MEEYLNNPYFWVYVGIFASTLSLMYVAYYYSKKDNNKK